MNKDEHVKTSDTILNSQSETLQEHVRGKRSDWVYSYNAATRDNVKCIGFAGRTASRFTEDCELRCYISIRHGGVTQEQDAKHSDRPWDHHRNSRGHLRSSHRQSGTSPRRATT